MSGFEVPNPILNSPFQEPARHFRFDEDVSISRTPATTKAQIEMIDAAEREFEESAKRAAALAKPAARLCHQ